MCLLSIIWFSIFIHLFIFTALIEIQTQDRFFIDIVLFLYHITMFFSIIYLKNFQLSFFHQCFCSQSLLLKLRLSFGSLTLYRPSYRFTFFCVTAWDYALFRLNAMGLCCDDGCHITWPRDIATNQALHETSLRHQAIPVALEKCPQSVPVQLILVVCLDLSPAPCFQDSAKAGG